MSLSSNFVLAILLFTLSGCNHLLYPADRHLYFEPEKIHPVPKNLKIPLPNTPNSFLHAWHFPAQSFTKKRRLVVHFHGNGQNLTTHFLFFKWMTQAGYDYLIFDYRGYGQSSDDRAEAKKTVEDGEAVFKYIYENYKDTDVIAIGQSLGSNVLVRTLQEINRKKQLELLPQLLVLDSSFLSYQQAARSVLSQRWFLYPLKPFTYLVLSDEWSAKKTFSETPHLPAIFFHGTKDPIIQFELGQNNFESWPGPKVFSSQENGGHTSAFGDPRFSNQKNLLLKCIDSVIEKKESFEYCIK